MMQTSLSNPASVHDTRVTLTKIDYELHGEFVNIKLYPRRKQTTRILEKLLTIL